MNNKEKYLHKILDAVVESCSYIRGEKPLITKEDILDKFFSINKIMVKRTGRAKPMTAKAGVTKTKRRYACGGKMKK